MYGFIARYQEAKLVELNIEHRTPRGYSAHCWLCLGFAILCAGENPFYFASKFSREVGALLYMYDVVFLIVFAILLKEDYTIHTLTMTMTYNTTLSRKAFAYFQKVLRFARKFFCLSICYVSCMGGAIVILNNFCDIVALG